MKKTKLAFFILVFSIGVHANSYSQVNSIRGPFHLTPAWNAQPGDITVGAHSRFYNNNKSFYQGSQFINSVSFWDIQSGVQVNYSYKNHFQFGLSQIVYQDNQKEGAGYNLPDDLTLQVKAGNFFRKNKAFRFGGKLSLRIPTAKYHNIILEPYASGKWTLGIFALASYSKSQNFPDQTLNLHANFGLIDHNDHGVYLYDNGSSEIFQRHNSREAIAAVGIVYPSSNFDFSAELLGNYFLTKPPATAFSRHSYLYFSPSVSYSFLYWLSFGVGMDLRLSPNRSSSSPAIDSDLPGYLPTYPTWRVNFYLRMNLSARLLHRVVRKEEKKPQKTVVVKPEDNIYQKINSEKTHIEKAELELMQLIEKRKQMDEILSRLKKALAEEKEKKAKKK